MTRTTIIIPTRNRRTKLDRVLRSIDRAEAEAAGRSLEVVVICDGDPETAAAAAKDNRVDRVTFVRRHSGSVFCRNLATQAAEGEILYATDDIELRVGSLYAAAMAMTERFPDGDGVVGFFQDGSGKFSPAGVALVGQAFLRRYPNRRLFYPGYFHFSAQEIAFAATRLGKIHLEANAALRHFHPKDVPAEMDHTHVEAREHRTADLALSKARQAAGLIWGLTDFDLPADAGEAR